MNRKCLLQAVNLGLQKNKTGAEKSIFNKNEERLDGYETK